MCQVVFNKNYKFKDLQKIFNTGNKSGKQVIDYISKSYKITKLKYGHYIIERELTFQEKLEQQLYNKNKQYIEPMLYTMLSNIKSNSVTMDMHELMVETAMVNKDFNYIKWHIKDCAKYLQTDETGLEIFTKESEPMLKRIIRDILFDMEDRQLIKVNELPTLGYKIYDNNTKSYYTIIQDIESVDDIQHLLEIKKSILNKIGKNKESELGYYERSHFRDLIAKEYGASYFYYKYNIILNTKDLLEYQNYDIINDIINLKNSFNQHIQNKLKKSKQGNLKMLTRQEKDLYIKYCIDNSQDYKLRLKHIDI